MKVRLSTGYGRLFTTTTTIESFGCVPPCHSSRLTRRRLAAVVLSTDSTLSLLHLPPVHRTRWKPFPCFSRDVIGEEPWASPGWGGVSNILLQHSVTQVASFPVLPTPAFVSQPCLAAMAARQKLGWGGLGTRHGCETKAGVGRTGNEAITLVEAYTCTCRGMNRMHSGILPWLPLMKIN